PEELPIIITMVLALGGLVLARKHVLIRTLRAAETLGSVTTIVTDKTGTITQNKMTLSRIATDGSVTTMPNKGLSDSNTSLLKVGVLTSAVRKSPTGGYTGDPLEVALLNAAKDNDLSPEKLQSQSSKVEEFAFDNQRKMMSVVYQKPDGFTVYAKGAPEVIIARCFKVAVKTGEKEKTGEDEARVLKEAHDMAADALRVIAFAYKNVQGETPLTKDTAESELVFLGLAGMNDPPRADIADAIRATREAGIRTIMVTGDLPVTAQKIAEEVGIDKGGRYVTGTQLAEMKGDKIKKEVKEVSIFARINPAQKLDIVKALQENGEIVAVTGDGINDAPALKSADIGIAMGENGTEAARQAAGMVLTNDSYSSIVDGVREGRRIFDNLSKGVIYYLGVKVALVLVFIIPLALSLPFPFAPIQIVLLELFMDLAASATFAAEPMEANTMHRPPRNPKRRFMDSCALTTMTLASLSLTAAVLFNYLSAYYGGRDPTQAGTIAFATWMVGHIFLAFTMRSQRETLFKIGLFTNPAMLIWSAAVVVFLAVITFIPAFHPLMRVTSLTGTDWLMAIVVPFVTVFWYEIKKAVAH
ncbi:MAG: cation-transporting P-type ATPase, partial [Chloroflexota bacterium]